MLRQLADVVKLSYIMSDEVDRIPNPEMDMDKRNQYCVAVILCAQLVENGEAVSITADDPEFPKRDHFITLTFDDGVLIDPAKAKLSQVISTCDEMLVTVDLKGNPQITVLYADIWRAKGNGDRK